MTLHIPTSYEASLNRHYAEVSARLRGRTQPVVLKVEPQQEETANPTEPNTRERQIEFIKVRCRMMATRYEDITAEHMTMRDMTVRDQILLEVKERWPRTRNRRLAELFHRSEKAIRDALARLNDKKAGRSVNADALKRMRQMRAQGMTNATIAEEIGICEGTVRYHLGKKR